LDHADGELEGIWPELQGIAAPARERRRLSPAIFKNLILALCARAPLSVRDLSLLLDRSEAYLGDAIRPLVAAGQIRFLFPDQPKHPRQKYIAAEIETAVDPDTLADSADLSPDTVIMPSAPSRPTAPLQPSPPTPLPPSQPSTLDPARPKLSRDAEDMIARASARRDEAQRQIEFSASRAGVVRDTARGAHHRDEPAQLPADAATETTRGWGSPTTSILAAMIIGVILAIVVADRWVYYALAISILFAILHAVAGSRQYLLYLTRSNMRAKGPRASDAAFFVLAKAAFSFGEIAFTVLLVALVRRLIP
jgi:hypothetical protein